MNTVENIKNVSFVVVVIGADRVEVAQYREAEASRMRDYIADAVVAFCNKHGTAIDRVIVRPINS